jgi:hypothetical protein
MTTGPVFQQLISFFARVAPLPSVFGASLLWAKPQEVLIDLSTAHTIESVLDSGVKVSEYSTGTKDRGFLILEGQNLRVRLPGGMELQQVIAQGSMDVDASGNLVILDFYGNILPLQEAYDVAVNVHHALGIPLARLEKWREDIKGREREANSYINGTGAGKTHPHVTIEIQHSMNRLYPWVVGVEFAWNVLEFEKDLTEKWGAEHNPRPPPDLERLSLDSPLGKVYDRKEAFREINAEQEELERITSWLAWLLVVIAATVSSVWMFPRQSK